MKTYVEIDTQNILHNVLEIKKNYAEYKYMIAVLKSGAYGHGEKIVEEVKKGGADYIAVSYLKEALEIRKYDQDIPVLCLQPINKEDLQIAIRNKITLSIPSHEYLVNLLSLHIKEPIKLHLQIDSGMGRLGFQNEQDVFTAVNLIKSTEYLELEGIYTHLATTGIFDSHYDEQIKRFQKITSLIDLKEIPMVHLSSSVNLMIHERPSFVNAFRVGILLYGYNVCPTESKVGLKNKLRLARNNFLRKIWHISKTTLNVTLDVKPAMKFITGIIQIKRVEKNTYLGYGATYKVKKDMLVAILPVGYANGIRPTKVLIKDKLYPVVGEISMNMIMIQVDEDVKLNDKVTILGDGITLGAVSRDKDMGIAQTLIEIGNQNERVYK